MNSRETGEPSVAYRTIKWATKKTIPKQEFKGLRKTCKEDKYHNTKAYDLALLEVFLIKISF